MRSYVEEDIIVTEYYGDVKEEKEIFYPKLSEGSKILTVLVWSNLCNGTLEMYGYTYQ